MRHESYWNHNTAYLPWLLSQSAGAKKALDVGCGDGWLEAGLADAGTNVLGIDTNEQALRLARRRLHGRSGVQVARRDFLADTNSNESFDLIIFAASLHHLDTGLALQRAADLLVPGGRLLVVGLAARVSVWDLLVDAARWLPSKVISWLHHQQSNEMVTRDPTEQLATIKAIAATTVPGAKFRLGLHYRYLMSWRKPDA